MKNSPRRGVIIGHSDCRNCDKSLAATIASSVVGLFASFCNGLFRVAVAPNKEGHGVKEDVNVGSRTYRFYSDEMRRIVQEGLGKARNAASGWELVRVLCSAHGHPKTAMREFPIDRRALAAGDRTDLTEGQVRGAIALLIRAGVIEVVEQNGSAYQMTSDGLRKKPVRYRFARSFLEAILDMTRLGRRILGELRAKVGKVVVTAKKAVKKLGSSVRAALLPKDTSSSFSIEKEKDVSLGEKSPLSADGTLQRLRNGHSVDETALHDALATIVVKDKQGVVMTLLERCFLQLARDWAAGRYCAMNLRVADSNGGY